MGHDPDTYYDKQQVILEEVGVKPPPGSTYEERLSLHLHHTLVDKLEVSKYF